MEVDISKKRNYDDAMISNNSYAHLSDEQINNEIAKLTGMSVDGSTTDLSPAAGSGAEGEPPNKKTAKEPNADADLELDDPSALHVHIIPTEEENYAKFLKINPYDIMDQIQHYVGEYTNSRTLKSGTILVELESNKQVKVLIREVAKHGFRGISAEVKIAYNVGTIRGVIRDARLSDMDSQTLLHKLQSQGVVHVRPIITGSGVSRKRSEYTILTFRLETLPEKVLFG